MTTFSPPQDQRFINDLSDLYKRVATLEAQASAAAGTYAALVCTSSTRPASPLTGTEIYETDTKRFLIWSGSAWEQKAFATFTCTSSTRPGAPFTGMQIYETDTIRYLIYNGSSWEQKSFTSFVCTSSTRPAAPFTGLGIWETDTGRTLVYDGSAWQAVIRSSQIINTLAAASGSVNFTTTTEADLTGATVTFTTTHANAVCQVIGIFDMQVITAGSGVGLGMLTVDGTDQSGQAIFAMTTSGTRATLAQTWQPTLASAGSHTLKLRGNLSAAAGSLTFNSSHTRIAVTCYDL